MQKGTVRYYARDRGYGFIKPDDEDREIFFHVTSLINFKMYEDDIQEGDIVTFEIGMGNKGSYAHSIKVESRYWDGNKDTRDETTRWDNPVL